MSITGYCSSSRSIAAALAALADALPKERRERYETGTRQTDGALHGAGFVLVYRGGRQFGADDQQATQVDFELTATPKGNGFGLREEYLTTRKRNIGNLWEMCTSV